VIEFNVKNAEGRFADIAKAVGISAGSDREAITKLCEKIDACNAAFGIPKTLKDFGILENEFKEKVAKIAELAVGDACTGANPRRVSPAEMEKLLNCVYYGTKVDFLYRHRAYMSCKSKQPDGRFDHPVCFIPFCSLLYAEHNIYPSETCIHRMTTGPPKPQFR
jgi:hypothetical protein